MKNLRGSRRLMIIVVNPEGLVLGVFIEPGQDLTHEQLLGGLVQLAPVGDPVGAGDGNIGELGHGAAPEKAKTEDFRLSVAFQAALPDAGRYANSSVRRGLSDMGDTGFEPVTPCVS